METITGEEKNMIEKQLQVLLKKIKTFRSDMQEAKALGDLSENSAYDEAKVNLEKEELRYNILHNIIRRSKVVGTLRDDRIQIGDRLRITSENKVVECYLFHQFYHINIESDEAVVEAITKDSVIGELIINKLPGDFMLGNSKIKVETPYKKQKVS